MTHWKIITALVAAFLVASCATHGEYILEDQFESFRNDIVSAEQLVAALGPPTVAIPREDGHMIWLYRGIYKQADAGNYVPYLGLLIGTNSKTCTQLSVVVSKDDGSLSDWRYTSQEGREFWAKTNDKCNKEGSGTESELEVGAG